MTGLPTREGLAHLWRALPTLLRIGFAQIIAYRAEVAIWVLSATTPLIMLALWNAVAADGPVAGLDQDDMARYFTATLVVRQLTTSWMIWQLNYQIRTGELSPRLLRPMHPLVVEAGTMLADKPFRLVVIAPVLLALVAWRPELWSVPEPAALVLFLVTVLVAWLLLYLVQALFGMLAFWLDQSAGLFGVWFATWGLLSGYVAPLAVFPAEMQGVLDWLPFRYMLALPVELLGGFLTAREALPQLGIQLAWLVVLFALTAFTWRRGVRHYGAFGA